ncbi:hypothetical protein [Anaeromyxobacter sp. SG66]|uniref:hypothetical protein n=1 Tax=Anaeromyxobacter sp. SG66 TaxID=2925410 RepID=UPI001F590C89|nr:hypothetical protein [Anaeromyxobacter sp. SG66]
MFLCVPVAFSHRIAEIQHPGDSIKAGIQAAGGFAMVGGLLALVLKAFGLLARLFRKPTPQPKRLSWYNTKSGLAGATALIVAMFGGAFAPPLLVVVAESVCTMAMLGFAVREAHAELSTSPDQAPAAPRPHW